MGEVRWDPEVLARMGLLHVRARQAVDGLRLGAHRSIRVAPNVEFADYKEYTPGDNLRDLDWRVAARSDRLVVRRHEAESELPVTILLDASGDLGTGRAGVRQDRPPIDGTKWGYAIVLAATLAYYLETRREPVGLAFAGGDGVRWPWVPARVGRAQTTRLLGALAESMPGGRAELGETIARLGTRIPRRSLVVVISDLMEEPGSWGPQLAALAARRVDLRVVHLYDRAEWALDYSQPARFLSPEGGEALPIDPVAARAAMREVVEDYLVEVRRYLGAFRGQHVLTSTDEPMDRVLGRLLRGL